VNNPTTVEERKIQMMLEYYANNKSIWSLLAYLSPEDFEHAQRAHPLLLIMLDCARWEATRLRRMRENKPDAEVPFEITSDWRKGDSDSEHGESKYLGVDLSCRKRAGMTEAQRRWYTMEGCYRAGFHRVGHYCDDKHLHVGVGDLINPVKFPVDRNWVRECDA